MVCRIPDSLHHTDLADPDHGRLGSGPEPPDPEAGMPPTDRDHDAGACQADNSLAEAPESATQAGSRHNQSGIDRFFLLTIPLQIILIKNIRIPIAEIHHILTGSEPALHAQEIVPNSGNPCCLGLRNCFQSCWTPPTKAINIQANNISHNNQGLKCSVLNLDLERSGSKGLPETPQRP